MSIDKETVILLRERIQNAKDGVALTHFPVRWNVVEALLTAASNEARLQRLYDAQQDLIEDQARKLHAAQREVEALRAMLAELRAYVADVWFAEEVATEEEMSLMRRSKQALTPPAASEEDAS